MSAKVFIKHIVFAGVLLTSTVLFTACSSHRSGLSGAYGSVGADGVSQDDYYGAAYSGEDADGSLEGQGMTNDGSFDGESTNNDNSQMSQAELLDITTYHFEFDSAQILPSDKPAIIAQAHYLANHPRVKVLLAGNTDSRGSREYNVALGLRRAQSVEKLMLLNGANHDQMMVTSYGEEKPVAFGDSEAVYQQNRRVDLTYEN